jgi:hypothetical protein
VSVKRNPDASPHAGTKRNLTVQLDEEVIRRAKALAARRGMSVSGLVAQQIAELTAAEERYQRARESALATMDRARDRGGRQWVRDELYDDRLRRFGP